MSPELKAELKKLRNTAGWCWIKDDPESTYPDIDEAISDGWNGANTGLHTFEWGVSAGTSYVVRHFDEEGELHNKEFDTLEEAQAFMATAHLKDPT